MKTAPVARPLPALRQTIHTPNQLLSAGLIDSADLQGIAEVAQHFAIGLSPQIRDLINEADPLDPIAAQFVPDGRELQWHPDELLDPIGDQTHSPTPGIVHRYPDRALFKLTNACPVYCRFCFRRETVGPGSEGLNEAQIDDALAYLKSTPQIWEVVLSGGDPLILAPRRLKKIMRRLNAIKHVGVIRFHTRVPVVRPDIVNAALIDALKIDKAVYVVLHTNHARELTAEARAACSRLVDSGFPMLSQTVLLRGVNADVQTLTTLFRSLVAMRIKPYYLHHGDLARGTSHFRTSIEQGQEIMRELRRSVSGLCQPLYVVDIPGGYGKVPIGPSYIQYDEHGAVQVTDIRGDKHAYPSR